jgi:ABC-2 type transport system permease protein
MSARQKPSALGGISLVVRRELSHYFKTWSGYVITAAMLAITGLLYNVFAVGSTPRYSADVISDFFWALSGTAMTAALFFSMRLIAEERQTGTYPVLASSQLSDGQIVLAKFLSVGALLAIYCLLTLPMPLLVLVNGKVAASHLFAGYLGVMLIGLAAASMGLFGSSLVDSQLVALIIGAVVLVGMLLLWLTAMVVEGSLGDLLGYLSLHNKHFDPFKAGTVSVANIVFYLSVIGFFLMLSRSALEARRWGA